MCCRCRQPKSFSVSNPSYFNCRRNERRGRKVVWDGQGEGSVADWGDRARNVVAVHSQLGQRLNRCHATHAIEDYEMTFDWRTDHTAQRTHRSFIFVSLAAALPVQRNSLTHTVIWNSIEQRQLFLEMTLTHSVRSKYIHVFFLIACKKTPFNIAAYIKFTFHVWHTCTTTLISNQIS